MKLLKELLNDRVLIEEIKEDKGDGIQVASSAKSNYTLAKGKIVQVDKTFRMQSHLEIGDVVYFAWGDKINIDGKDLYLVAYSNMAGIL